MRENDGFLQIRLSASRSSSARVCATLEAFFFLFFRLFSSAGVPIILTVFRTVALRLWLLGVLLRFSLGIICMHGSLGCMAAVLISRFLKSLFVFDRPSDLSPSSCWGEGLITDILSLVACF